MFAYLTQICPCGNISVYYRIKYVTVTLSAVALNNLALRFSANIRSIRTLKAQKN